MLAMKQRTGRKRRRGNQQRGSRARLSVAGAKPYVVIALTVVLVSMAVIVIFTRSFSSADKDKAWAVLFAVIGFWLGTKSD